MLYLVRVLERQSAGVKPFDEVVDGLRRELLQQRFVQAEAQYVERIRQGAKVATIFDTNASGEPTRVARLPRMANAVLQQGEPTPAVGNANGAPTDDSNNSATPTRQRQAAPESGQPTPAPATSQVIPAAPRGATGATSQTSGVRPANMLEVGEKVRQGVYLESTQAPPAQRLPGGPSSIPNRRPSAAVTGPSAGQWKSSENSAMMAPGNSTVR
jgi:hypothetical protein